MIQISVDLKKDQRDLSPKSTVRNPLLADSTNIATAVDLSKDCQTICPQLSRTKFDSYTALTKVSLQQLPPRAIVMSELLRVQLDFF